MRTASYDATQLEAQIGPIGSTRVDSTNRGQVQNWLVAKGVPSAAVKKMKVATLHKAYNRPRYLATILEHGAEPLQHGAEPIEQPVPAGHRACMVCGIPTTNPDGICSTCAAKPRQNCRDCGASVVTCDERGLCHNCAPNYRTAAQHKLAGKAPDQFIIDDPEEPEPMPRDDTSKADAARKLADALAAITALSAQPLDEARVLELIAEHAPKAETVIERIEITLVKPDDAKITLGDEPRHKQFAQVLRAVQCGNVFLRGPAGSGKTTIAAQIAKALEIPFLFTGAVASEYKLLGFIDAQGRSIRTPFREAYEHGGLFLFDEIDASAPAALLAFNAALGNGHMDFPDGVVQKHPNFKCIAAGNTFGRGADRVYVGRNQLDAATLDRFIFVDFDYDEALERQLARSSVWVDRVQAVRRAVAALKLRHVVSPRASIMGAKLLDAGADITEVERMTLWRGLDAETVAKIEANIQ